MTGPSILALVTDAFGGRGGIAQYNRDLLTALADGRSIEVLPRHAPDPVGVLPNGLHQRRALFRRLPYMVAAFECALRVRPQVIFSGHLFMAPVAAVLARVTGAYLIIQLHGIEAWKRPSRVYRAALEMAELVLCVSRDTRARLLSWSTISPERVIVLPNTVGDAFRPGNRQSARARFGLSDQRVVLSVGRLDSRERYKGYDQLLVALSELIAKDPKLLYLIAGDGDDRSRLAAVAAEAGVTDHVWFLGSVPSDALPDLYRAADVFALPSTGEGFGIVFLEATACGTRAIGLAAAGSKDALCDGQLGTLAELDDLAETLARALSAPSTDAETLCSEVQERFGRDRFSKRALAVFDRFAA